MIVSIGLGETGVNVTLDDECEVYSPIRLVEMCNVARGLFYGAYKDTLGVDPDALVEDPPAA